VLTPSRRLAVSGLAFDLQTSDATETAAWVNYLRLYAPPAGSAAAEGSRLLSDERAVRLASSAFSYVLTLSAFLPRLVSPVGAVETSDGDKDRPVALHVVGARAEAMMPDYLWDEVALLHPQRRALEITLVGDHVPISRKVRSARGLPLQVEAVRGLYHDVTLPSPDALVLFNPGIGHPLLRDRWSPTVRTMLESGKPLLLTAFSAADQERDVDVLRQLATGSASGRRLQFLVEPRVNPFRSLKFQVNNDGGSVALIQTNSHVMAVQLVD
jgi:splicing suppressor protein 51